MFTQLKFDEVDSFIKATIEEKNLNHEVICDSLRACLDHSWEYYQVVEPTLTKKQQIDRQIELWQLEILFFLLRDYKSS